MDYHNESKSLLYVILSFLLPSVIIGAAYIVFGMYPFGEKSILIMDMSSQYIEFFSGYRNMLLNGQSILFSWAKCFGTSFIGLFAYYLSSPLSLLILLFPEDSIVEALMAINILKIGLSGLSFSIFLRYLYKRNNITIVIFSVFYALMSYTVAYSMNLMWLDGVIWLPIIIIGVERLLRNNRPVLFIISLTVMFISNYYISYSIGLFSFIYFIYRYFISYRYSFLKEKPSLKAFIKDIIKKAFVFAGSAAVSAGCAAWLLLPAFFNLMQGKIGGANYNPDQFFNFKFTEFFSSLLVGSYDSITNAGLPKIFCGMLTIILLGLFFTSKNISRMEKAFSAVIIMFMILSFYIKGLDMAWHVFQYPNWFPYRYSFIFTFFVVTLAYKGFISIAFSGLKALSGIFTVILLIICEMWKVRLDKIGKDTILLGLLFTVLYFLTLFILRFILEREKYWESGHKSEHISHHKSEHKSKYISERKSEHISGYIDRHRAKAVIFILLLVLSTLEMYTNTIMLLHGLDNEFHYDSRSSYVDFRNKLKPLLNQINSSDKSFYRTEKTFERKKNDAIGLGYNGITHYSSTYNANVNKLLKELGFAQEYFWSSYYGSTIFTDSLFAVKYIMSEAPLNSYYQEKGSNDNIDIYKNPYALPLGYLVDRQLLDVNLLEPNQNKINSLMLQNKIMKSMMAGNKDYNNEDYYIEVSDVKMETYNLAVKKKGGFTRYTLLDSDAEGYIKFTLSISGGNASGDNISDGSVSMRNVSGGSVPNGNMPDGNVPGGDVLDGNLPGGNPVYAYFPANMKNTCELYVNGNYIIDKSYSWGASNVMLGVFENSKEAERVIEVMLKVKEGAESFELCNNMFYIFDMCMFEHFVNALKETGLQTTYFDGTYLRGRINVDDRQNNSQFTSDSNNKFSNQILFTSIPYDKGWRVRVNEKKVEPVTFSGTFMCIEVQPGENEIELKYIPVGLMPGIYISLMSVSGLIIIIITQSGCVRLWKRL
jgi:uncharacterized membrane protein YfhO